MNELYPPTPEQAPAKAPVPIDQARFTDPLEPVYEQTFRDALNYLHETGSSFDKPLLEMWQDDSLPTAYRDRAMLILVSDSPKDIYDGRVIRTGAVMGGLQPVLAYWRQDALDGRHMYTWLKDLQLREIQDGKELVHPAKKLILALDMFKREEIDGTEFESCLNTIDLHRATPDEVGLDEYRKPGRMPIVYDALVYGDGGDKVKEWSYQKLIQFFQRDADIAYQTMPLWTAQISQKQIIDVYTARVDMLIKHRANYEDTDEFNVEIEQNNTELNRLWPGMVHYGLQHCIKNFSQLKDLMSPYIPQQIQEEALSFTLRVYCAWHTFEEQTPLFRTEEDADRAVSIAQKSGLVPLIERAEEEQQATQKYLAEREARDKAEKLERAEMSRPGLERRDRAAAKFSELLNSVRTHEG